MNYTITTPIPFGVKEVKERNDKIEEYMTKITKEITDITLLKKGHYLITTRSDELEDTKYFYRIVDITKKYIIIERRDNNRIKRVLLSEVKRPYDGVSCLQSKAHKMWFFSYTTEFDETLPCVNINLY